MIYIEANTGACKRVGRSDAYATEFDLEAEEYVPIPKGEVHKKKEIVQDVTLHDLDVANARPQGGQAERDTRMSSNSFSHSVHPRKRKLNWPKIKAFSRSKKREAWVYLPSPPPPSSLLLLLPPPLSSSSLPLSSLLPSSLSPFPLPSL